MKRAIPNKLGDAHGRDNPTLCRNTTFAAGALACKIGTPTL